MKVKGTLGMSVVLHAIGGEKEQPSDSKRSADPEDEVEARFPC